MGTNSFWDGFEKQAVSLGWLLRHGTYGVAQRAAGSPSQIPSILRGIKKSIVKKFKSKGHPDSEFIHSMSPESLRKVLKTPWRKLHTTGIDTYSSHASPEGREAVLRANLRATKRLFPKGDPETVRKSIEEILG